MAYMPEGQEFSGCSVQEAGSYRTIKIKHVAPFHGAGGSSLECHYLVKVGRLKKLETVTHEP